MWSYDMGIALGEWTRPCESGCGHGRVGVVLEEWVWGVAMESGCGPEPLSVAMTKWVWS